ncbi:MAG TPA: CHASE2 domain-containing protein, partial [Burkholderiaceae bacterium]|nr:CHASE2 domain-containing protein [Burkholderiaceae bacterium]
MTRVSGLLLDRPWWPAALLVASAFVFWPPLQRAELWVYDLMAPVADAPSGLVVVAVDEASIAELGQWPWPRDHHAQLLDRLDEAGAA